MRHFIPELKVIYPGHKMHNEVVNLLIEDGIIKAIGTDVQSDAEEIWPSGLCLSPGLVDVRARAYDPGFPEKESISSLLSAAAAGGYTHVGLYPDTLPPVDNRAVLEYVKGRAKGASAHAVLMGHLSIGGEGADMSEMYDMKAFGARLFTDGHRPLRNSLFLKVAMEYAASVNAVLMLRPDDPYLMHSGEVREDLVSHETGIPGIPAMSEKLGIDRLCELAEYTSCQIHLSSISTIEGVHALRKWREKGLSFTADVNIAHLSMNSSGIKNFDSLWKHQPPLGSAEVAKALANAVSDGLIDIVSSDHDPQDTEAKDCEFHLAQPGISCIQASFNLFLKTFGNEQIDLAIDRMSLVPRKLLKIPMPALSKDKAADFVLYALNEKQVFEQTAWHSLSTNFPFFGEQFDARVLTTFTHPEFSNS